MTFVVGCGFQPRDARPPCSVGADDRLGARRPDHRLHLAPDLERGRQLAQSLSALVSHCRFFGRAMRSRRKQAGHVTTPASVVQFTRSCHEPQTKRSSLTEPSMAWMIAGVTT